MGAILFGDLKLAFFDIDGTLLRRDFDGALSVKSQAVNFAVAKIFGLDGADYTKTLGKKLYGMTDKLILKTFLAEYGIDEKEYYGREREIFVVINDYYEKNRNRADNVTYSPLPGVIQFLQWLKAGGIRLGIVTGNIEQHSRWKLEPAGLSHFFTTGGFGDDAETRSDIMKTAIRRNPDIKVDQICHFGDSPADLEAASDCSLKAVAITDRGGGTHSREELETVGYGLLIDSWTQWDQISIYLNEG
jgi:phosphoglycolate phosphatase-like HAD superfamily hydrolase